MAANLLTGGAAVYFLIEEADYIVDKFDQPIAAIISIADYELLQAARQQAAVAPTKEATVQTIS